MGDGLASFFSLVEFLAPFDRVLFLFCNRKRVPLRGNVAHRAVRRDLLAVRVLSGV